MPNEPPDTARPLPPYSAFASFAAFVERAASSEVPARVDRSLLAEWEVAAGNESSVLTTLRSLGFIDPDGRPTEAYRALRLSPPRRLATLRESVRAAYPGLPGPDEPPPSDDALHDYFVEQRGLTGQMVQKAMRFYRQLSAMARGATGEAAARRPRASAAKRVTVVPSPSGGIQSEGLDPGGRAPQVEGRREPGEGDGAISATVTLVLQVPLDATEADLEGFFRRLRKAWAKSRSGSG